MTMYKNKIIIFFIFFSSLDAQVNTEAMRSKALNDGIYNSLKLDLGYEEANVVELDASAGYRLDYINNNNHFFITSNYSNKYSKNENEPIRRNANKGFIHIRYTRKIFEKLFMETFTQIGFNDFLDMKQRILFGLGLRKPVKLLKNLEFYFGNSIMREMESYDLISENDKNLFRISNYCTFKIIIDDKIIIGNTVYHQIAITEFEDQRLLYDGDIKINIKEKLSINIDLNYRYDNLPHGNLGKSYFEIKNGLIFDF